MDVQIAPELARLQRALQPQQDPALAACRSLAELRHYVRQRFTPEQQSAVLPLLQG